MIETTPNKSVYKIGESIDLNGLSVSAVYKDGTKELIENGTIPVYSANVKTVFGKIDKLLITSFDTPSIIWGIDGDWMVNFIPEGKEFYPTDHCGVLRVKDTDTLNPHFVMYLLRAAGQKAGFNRTYRASIDRVGGLSIPNVPIAIQNEVMNKVDGYEKAIKKEEERILTLIQEKRRVESELITFS